MKNNISEFSNLENYFALVFWLLYYNNQKENASQNLGEEDPEAL